jgi:hypothetical protein
VCFHVVGQPQTEQGHSKTIFLAVGRVCFWLLAGRTVAAAAASVADVDKCTGFSSREHNSCTAHLLGYHQYLEVARHGKVVSAL